MSGNLLDPGDKILPTLALPRHRGSVEPEKVAWRKLFVWILQRQQVARGLHELPEKFYFLYT